MRFRIRISITRKHIKYFKTNWGATFIIAFQILLICAAVYLSMGIESIANEIAIYAYYSLVIGVILQLVSYVRYERKRGGVK